MEVIEADLGRDIINNEPVKDIVSLWKQSVETRQGAGRLASMFWLAGPDEKTTQAIDYVAEQLSIDRGAVIELEIDPDQTDVSNNLLRLTDRVKSIDGNRVLIIARGFEQVIDNITDSWRLSRAGHDWDQNVIESPHTGWGKLYIGINKHMVIITTIGFSAGTATYNEAVKIALVSKYRSGIIELK